MKKLFLIDGNAILHKAYHALPPFKTEDGTLVNAVYGFASLTLNLLNQYDPDYIAVAFDVKAKTFRHIKYEDYKGTRKKAPDDLYGQLPLIKDLLVAFNIPIFEMPGYEADDVLGTLAKQGDDKGYIHTFVVTGDLDTLQLVSDRTSVFAMHRGFSNPIVFDEKAVFDRYGLYPNQIVDMKALQGDSSDNIKGVAGIGQKTTKDLLSEYKNLENVYKNLENIKESVKKKLEKDKDSAFLSQELARIIIDIKEISLDLEESNVYDYNEDVLNECFKRFEFNTLNAKLNRFYKLSAKKKFELSGAQGSLF